MDEKDHHSGNGVIYFFIGMIVLGIIGMIPMGRIAYQGMGISGTILEFASFAFMIGVAGFLAALAWAPSGQQEKQRKDDAPVEDDNKLDDRTWQLHQKLNGAWRGLWDVLDQLSDGQELGVDIQRCQEARELLPLAMLGFVVRAQGRATPEQQRFLRKDFVLLRRRYTLSRFIEMAVDRSNPDWERLCGMDDDYCGEVWKTVIELICRTRRTELTAPFAENLQALATYFYLLGQPWSEDINTLIRKKFDAFEYHAAALQKEVPLRLMMALQDALARRLGGQEADYVPDKGKTEFMNGCVGMTFAVYNDDFGQMPRFFWVNKLTEQVWEQIPGGDAVPLDAVREESWTSLT